MLKFFRWLDDNILSILAGFLFIFIPLYPKLPLFDILPGYIVRVRLEDILVSVTICIWILQLLRRKITLANNPLLKPISAYLVVGLLSLVSAVFITQTIPMQSIHFGKSFLHFLRRVEYFSLFFIFYSSIKSIRQIKFYMGVLILTVIGVVVYGFGQKYLYWPAFSTMNREFSKGWVLYLTQHARVLSTFGGHYDLAAFIMMVLILLWSLFFGVRKWIQKVFVIFLIAGAFWTLILTASRTSFIAYLFGLTCMFFFWSYLRGLVWSLSRLFVVVTLSIVLMLSFGDLSERFTKLLKIDQRISGIKSMLLTPFGAAPTEKALFLENSTSDLIAQITSKSDQPPTPLRPSDVYADIPLNIPIGTTGAVLNVGRTYSPNAFRYDLSMAIRLDALWPMAIKGFKRNPLLGSGYATLNKTQATQFTEAESTDNDFLRSLGETGLLGFVTFYGILFIILYFIWKNLTLVHDRMLFSLTVGLTGIIIGLLVNAVYIDVFESSKVAFTFWSMTGIILAIISILRKQHKGEISRPKIPGMHQFVLMAKEKSLRFFRSDLFPLLIILTLAYGLRQYKSNIPLADWHSWRQADTSAVSRNYVKHGINILFPTYDDLSNVASGKDNPRGLRFVEFPLYNIVTYIFDKLAVGNSVEYSGRFSSIMSALGSIVFIFLLVRKYRGRWEAYLSSFFYAVIPYNIFFTRVILPEPFAVFTSLGMLYFFDKSIEEIGGIRGIREIRGKIILYGFFTLLFTISAFLLKPFAYFLVFPMTYLVIKKFGLRLIPLICLLVYLLICLIPFAWWRWWISHFPEGIPAYTWLLNGDGIRFKGAFFQWIFADRIGRMIVGFWGLPLLVAGILTPLKKNGWFFHWWGISILVYLTVFATGNVRHDYYQTAIIPIISIYLAAGVSTFLHLSRVGTSKIGIYIILVICFIFMEMFGWYVIRDLYNINHPEIVAAGNAVERITKDTALVIAPYNGDTAFLYQTRRSGWPIVQGSIDDLIKKGAHYYVSVNFDDLTKQLIQQSIIEDMSLRKYELIELTDKYVIIQLVPDSKLPK